jgi:L-seryl-tRNA(Ser) seleniumtransferase
MLFGDRVFCFDGLIGSGGAMKITQEQQRLLRLLPGVDLILEHVKAEPFFEAIPKSVFVTAIRSVIEDLRSAVLEGRKDITEPDLSESGVIRQVKIKVQQEMKPNLVRLVNATGVVIHTNLGRSLLAEDAARNMIDIACNYSNLEFDLTKGARGTRYSCVEDLLCEITGAEAALAVNNNAGGVLLCLDTLSKGKKAVVSRGELIEIGGSFRIPDVMAKSGAILREVGTTNRTHPSDYENAIEEDTGLLLKVHTSNYSVVGFTAEVSLEELVSLGKKYNLPVMEDLGSGTFVDFSKHGMIKEPTVQESVKAGADVITFSGDKLLGGPQAGIIVGNKDILDAIRANPLTRALRIDKLTLAALESTLRLYRDEQRAVDAVPTLRMLTLPAALIENRARRLADMLVHMAGSRLEVRLIDCASRVGGGALPLLDLPSKCVGVRVPGVSPNAVERLMRENHPPVIGRLEEDLFMMDLRTIQDDELGIIKTAFEDMLNRG